MDLIKEIFKGNCFPEEISMDESSINCMKKFSEEVSELTKTLTPEQKIKLNTILETRTELHADESLTYFKNGFAFGVSMMVEIEKSKFN